MLGSHKLTDYQSINKLFKKNKEVELDITLNTKESDALLKKDPAIGALERSTVTKVVGPSFGKLKKKLPCRGKAHLDNEENKKSNSKISKIKKGEKSVITDNTGVDEFWKKIKKNNWIAKSTCAECGAKKILIISGNDVPEKNKEELYEMELKFL